MVLDPSSSPSLATTDADQSRSAEQAVLDLLQVEEPALRGVIRRYVHDDAVVDDLFQEVSLKAVTRLDQLRERSRMRGWLFRVARNASLDWLRVQARRPNKTELVVDLDPDTNEYARNPLDRLCSQERLQAIESAMADLPESQRLVLHLRLREGMDHAAIAQHLGISRQAVEVRLCRGRKSLKEKLLAILDGDIL
jgi:RNA polymerase sigma-70 factor (ECF subfamily)